ncbi:MAG: Gfo/Idh/MocA family oxidoreductase [Pirellulales bacterium]
MFHSIAAVVGTGFIGPVHVEGLIRAGVRVAGILGSSPEKSKAAANQLGLERGYASLEELLADPNVQVVHIASPNRAHYPQVLQCLAAGKHVLCEKPLAMNSQESRSLVDAATQSGLVCGVNYNIRFYPLCIEAAAKVQRGELGTLFHITGSYTQDWLLHSTDFNWRVKSEEGGPLRALADIGTHWLDLIQNISGLEVESVVADLQTVYPIRKTPIGGAKTFTTGHETTALENTPVDTEDYGCVMLRFRGGAHGVLYVSQVTAGKKNSLQYEIAGERCSLSWNSQSPNRLWIGRRDAGNTELIRDPSLMSPEARMHSTYPGGHNEGFPDTFKQLFRSFYSYIESDRKAQPRFPSFQDGHREILLCEAILESSKQGTWITVAKN